MPASDTIRLTLLLTAIALLSACVNLSPAPPGTAESYYLYKDNSLAGRYAPVIRVDEGYLDHNRIGRAAARLDSNGNEEIYIATDQAVFYLQEQGVSTARGDYKNIIYRFHLPRVPYRHLTGGDNGGLIIVVTLDAQERPVLITTVHSCGCYLAFLPTSYLDPSAYPQDWDSSRQRVYGEKLPGQLTYPEGFENKLRPMLHLRSGNHRVRDASVIDLTKRPGEVMNIQALPASALDQIPLGDAQTAFFHQSGWNRGYVKGSSKPWERLLMSWWSLDLHIGSDKALGHPDRTGVVFYTSLKPWARKASNMWFFDKFLEYWGWRL